MASGRDAVKLTDDEVQALLAENLKVQVASNGPDGVPHLTTLFYIVRDEPDSVLGVALAFWSYARSQKIRNLERDPRVSALVEDGTDYFELRGVSVQGKAEIVRDHDAIYSIGSEVATRMVGAESFETLGELGRETVEKQATKRVAVIIHPEKVATWDHRKLVGG
jgi:nitroimidazol reductase NimA-like FMN-containing flavoprotein (pyridoxamine 5'-phosphate oxidase superfamily)